MQVSERKIHQLGILLVCAVACLYYLPVLFTRGMFFDGLTYATISRNLAMGKGSWWCPFYTETLAPQFYGHPPLVFWIQSQFFRLLGDHYYTEKIYSTITFVLSAWLITRIWKLFYKEAAWLPVLLWLTFQVVKWCYANNFQENTMTIFCLLAAWCYLYALVVNRHFLFLSFAAGAMVLGATLCKGPVGLYPLAIPFIWFVVNGKSSLWPAAKAIGFSVLFLLLGYAALWQLPEAREALLKFLEIQLVPSLNGRFATGGSRLYILGQLLIQLLPVIGLLLITVYLRRNKDRQTPLHVLLFLLIALSAALPIMVSTKQMAIYLLPAMSFFALAAAAFIAPSLSELQRLPARVFTAAFVICYIGIATGFVAGLLRIGVPSRDYKIINALQELDADLPKSTIVKVSPELWENWALQAYLYRFYFISVNVDNANAYYLGPKESAPAGFIPVNTKGEWCLYKRP
ncbi:MAG: glycosyltransferase family 39 protein [Chitinophagales bacterium]